MTGSAKKPALRPSALGTQQGFTLLEVLVAVFILASLSTILYGAFKDTLFIQTKVQASQERWHVLRLGVNRMVRELEMSYVSLNQNMMAVLRRTYFSSKRQSDVDELTFSSLSHRRLVRNARESDQCVIRYYGAPDPDDRRKINLMRRETRRLEEKEFDEIMGESYVLIEDIVSLHYEFYDPVKDEWLEEWDTTTMDGQPNRLPPRIRIYLTVLDERGKEMTLLTEARLMLTDALNFTPPTSSSSSYGSSGSSQSRGLRSSQKTSGTPVPSTSTNPWSRTR